MGNILNHLKGSLFLLLLALAPIIAAASAAEVLGSHERGRALFEQKCAPCHSIGAGKKVGPDLSGVTERRNKEWLIKWIDNPEGMIASGDDTAKEVIKGYTIRMPSVGLSNEEINDVLGYLESQKVNVNLSEETVFKKQALGELFFSTRTYLQFYQDAVGNRYAPLNERVELNAQDREGEWNFRSSGLVQYDFRTPSGTKREMDELTYAFLTYTPLVNNGPSFKVGRYYVFDEVAIDQIDGIHASWDITPATGISVYGGRAVETEFDGTQGDYIYGGRVHQRIGNKAEIGASFLKEDNDGESYREELGIDVWLLPFENLELLGHSYWNNITKGWMEHSYTVRVPLKKVIISGLFGQSIYRNALSPTTLSAFSPELLGKDEVLTKVGGVVEIPLGRYISTIINYTGYDYKKSGDARYYGATVSAQWKRTLAGMSVHRMDGETERLRYVELRAYVKQSLGRMTFAADAVNLHYDFPISGQENAYSLSAAATYRINNAFSAGTDITYSKNPDFTHNTMALLKLIYNLRRDL